MAMSVKFKAFICKQTKLQMNWENKHTTTTDDADDDDDDGTKSF